MTRYWPADALFARLRPDTSASDLSQRMAAVRYHLGRGRRARETGRFEDACREARRAIALNPGNPWAYALLGQCIRRQIHPDLAEARRVLERACALDPSNGYFVRLLLDVLDAQGDLIGRDDALAWAWWNGAPVERWLPDGPRPRLARETGYPVGERAQRSASPDRTLVAATPVREGARV